MNVFIYDQIHEVINTKKSIYQNKYSCSTFMYTIDIAHMNSFSNQLFNYWIDEVQMYNYSITQLFLFPLFELRAFNYSVIPLSFWKLVSLYIPLKAWSLCMKMNMFPLKKVRFPHSHLVSWCMSFKTCISSLEESFFRRKMINWIVELRF